MRRPDRLVGSYTVTGSSGSVATPVVFDLINQLQPTFSGLSDQSITFGTANATFTGSLASGSQIPQGEDVAVTLGSVTQQAAIGSGGAFTTTFDTAGLGASTTAYVVNYAYAGDGIFLSTSSTSLLTVTQATPTITWSSPAGITYGTAVRHPARCDCFGAGHFDLHARRGHGPQGRQWPDAVSLVHAHRHHRLHRRHRRGDDQRRQGHADDYLVQPRGHHLRHRAVRHAARCDASVPGKLTYTPAAGTKLNAGNDQTLSVSFTPTDTTDYTNATDAVTINVAQATPTITWFYPVGITYGTALSGTQLDATASVPGTLTYTPAAGTILNVGNGQTLSVSFTPDDTTDYTNATDAVTIDVAQATPTINWTSPTSIIYGTALSSAARCDQLGAGRVDLHTGGGTVLNAGISQTRQSRSYPPTPLITPTPLTR